MWILLVIRRGVDAGAKTEQTPPVGNHSEEETRWTMQLRREASTTF